MADIAYCLPAGIRFSQDARIGFTRPGVDRNSGFGPAQSRGWGNRSMRTYSLPLNQFNKSGDLLEEFLTFWDQIGGGGRVGYIMEPVSAVHYDLSCGPLGDGVRTTFPIPVQDPSDVLIFKDGVIQTSGYTVHARANVINDDDIAACNVTSTTTVRASQATGSVVDHSKEGLHSVYALVADSGIPYVWNAHNTAPVTAANDYTGVAAFCSEVASSIRVELYAYNNTTSTDYDDGTYVTTVAGNWHVSSHTFTMPEYTDNLVVRVAEVISQNDVNYYVDCLAVCPGDYDRWHLPSQAPGLVEFDTAPASGVRITANATGQRITRVRFSSNPTFNLTGAGHAQFSGRLEAQEVWEF